MWNALRRFFMPQYRRFYRREYKRALKDSIARVKSLERAQREDVALQNADTVLNMMGKQTQNAHDHSEKALEEYREGLKALHERGNVPLH